MTPVAWPGEVGVAELGDLQHELAVEGIDFGREVGVNTSTLEL